LVYPGEVVVHLGELDEDAIPTFGCEQISIADQMVFEEESVPRIDGANIEEISLGEELFELSREAYAGYFRPNTNRLGRFYGVYSDKKLIAMGGERLRPANHWQELSTICTHPEYRNRGLATKITLWAVEQAMNENRQVFLHVDCDNMAAIRIYERLGFKKRSEIAVWKLLRLNHET
jgi:predicted GNAT family acetyltransferase